MARKYNGDPLGLLILKRARLELLSHELVNRSLMIESGAIAVHGSDVMQRP
jgi:hypothetical protein